MIQTQALALGPLQSATLQLAKGERLAIIGRNGAGKSTLLRALIGLAPAQSGSITLFGKPCQTEADFVQARPRIGFLFQESDDQLFCPSVIEDVAFGPLNLGMSQAQARARAEETLASLGLEALADKLTHQLSGGEKRLACLAGLLAMRPEVLLLDEPTNGVDATHRQTLRQALASFAGAMILVSHDAEFVAEIATRAMVLAEGQLTAAHIHG